MFLDGRMLKDRQGNINTTPLSHDPDLFLEDYKRTRLDRPSVVFTNRERDGSCSRQASGSGQLANPNT